MPILSGELQFTGTIGGLSAYRMRGSDKIIIRRKGGPSKQRIKKDKRFAMTRQYNEEWKACVLACRLLNQSLYPVKHLADHNYTGALTGLCKSIQKDDSFSELGERGIFFSQHYYKLEGFSLNKIHTLERFIRHPLQLELDRATATATMQLPVLIPGINLANPNKHPLYRLVLVLGAVPDIVYHEERKLYQPVNKEIHPVVSETAWYTARQTMEAGTLTAALPPAVNQQGYTLLLAAGIEFGVPLTGTEVKPVRDGAAKLVKML